MESESRRNIEWHKCSHSIDYWLANYVYIFNATNKDWVQFALWPEQTRTLRVIRQERQVIILKARQLGLSWLILCDALYDMLFRPSATNLIFSKREDEAFELLSRLKGIYAHLPRWMQARSVTIDSAGDWELSNGSSAKAFATTGGRSYTGSNAIVDEADFVQDLDELLNAVKPTIDAGGKLSLISTVDKARPESPFKRIYRAAKRNKTTWHAIFLPWTARPSRTPQWYEAQSADVHARTGALDDLHQEYPATDTEALAPRSLDKRIAPMWIEACYAEMEPVHAPYAPAIPGLEIYMPPLEDGQYVIGADPAEGNPNSDDSALTVLDWATGEEVAVLAGKYEPSTLADYIAAVSIYYNHAPAMPERNNHGHAVIQWLQEHARRVKILKGHDDKPGWMSSKLGKALLYTECADHFRNNATERTPILHSFASYQQLASIEGSSLRAPEGQHDDRADSYALAQVARAASVTAGALVAQSTVRNRGGSPNIRRSTRRVA